MDEGPAWSNSLFEDNAEFGLGMRITRINIQAVARRVTCRTCTGNWAERLSDAILNASQVLESEVIDQRKRVAELKDKLTVHGQRQSAGNCFHVCRPSG